MADLQDLQNSSYDNAKEKKFHEHGDEVRRRLKHWQEVSERTGNPMDAKEAKFWETVLIEHYGNRLMLIVGEISEAHEELRAGHKVYETYQSYPPVPPSLAVEFSSGAEAREHWESTQDGKPEGVPVELADAAIRMLDFAGEARFSLEDNIVAKARYNAGRPPMHGGKTM